MMLDRFVCAHLSLSRKACRRQAATVHHAPPNRSEGTRRRAYIQRWAGDGVTYCPRPNAMAIKRTPRLRAGELLAEDSALFPTAWRRADGPRL